MSAEVSADPARTIPSDSVTSPQQQIILTLIVAMPFLASPLAVAGAFGADALNLHNLIPALALLVFTFGGKVLPGRDVAERQAFLLFFVYVAFVLLAFVRSMPNIGLFRALWPANFGKTPLKYLEFAFAIPMLGACCYLYVLKRMCSPGGISRTVEAIGVAAFALSIVALAAIASNPDAGFSTDPERHRMLKLMSDTLGLHYNSVGTILAMTAPLILYMALQRGSFWTVAYFIALTAVMMVKSRTALFDFVGISAVTMLALGRGKSLLAAAPLIGIGALVLLGPVLIGLLSIGFSQRSGFSLYFFLSGREQSIWLPVILERLHDPVLLLLGGGTHSILTSAVVQSGATGFTAGQAHNFFLEIFLDNGLVGLALCMGAIVYLLVRGFRTGRRVNSGLYWVLYLCIVSFLVAGLTGRLYYPDVENYLMFPIMATLINVARLRLKAVAKVPASQPRVGQAA